MPSPTVILTLVFYLALLIGIGFWGSRHTRDVAGYYAAGKKLPSWVIAFSTNATGESAWLLLGLTGMGYLVGFHALWVVLGEVLGVALSWVLVARPFREYTGRLESITVPDYLEDRFRDHRHWIRLASAAIIFTMVVAYMAAQITASGKAFNAFTGVSYTTGLLIAIAVILFYTTVGGFKAVAYADVLQGMLMFASMIVLPAAGFLAAGGWLSVMESLREIDPNLLFPLGQEGLSLAGISSAAGFMGVGLAFLGAPQLLVRYISARSRDEIVSGSLIAVVCIIVFDLGAVFTGIAGRVLFPGLADPETIMPTMSTRLFPDFLTGIFLAVVLAAILSTVDSLLILASSAVVRDVIQKIYCPDLSERRLSLYGKLTTLVIGAGALLLALGEVRVIFWFVLFAWSGLGAAFGPPILCSLFWKRTTLAGAVAGMGAGFLTTMLWALGFKEYVYGLYEMVPGFLVGLGVTLLVSHFTPPPAGAAAEWDEVWKAVGPAFGTTAGKEK